MVFIGSIRGVVLIGLGGKRKVCRTRDISDFLNMRFSAEKNWTVSSFFSFSNDFQEGNCVPTRVLVARSAICVVYVATVHTLASYRRGP